jgi:hypothetical protein
MKPPSIRQFNLFLIISFLEGIGVVFYMLTIPGDPKNAVLLGYSANRLLMLASAIIMLLLLVMAGTIKSLRERLRTIILPSPWLVKRARIILWVTFLLAWLTIWMPPYRLGGGSASFIRLQPLLIWFELLVLQFSLLVWISKPDINWQSAWKTALKNKKGWLLWVILFLSAIVLFGGLTLAKSEFTGNQLYFPPGAPLSALQVFIVWGLFSLLLIEDSRREKRSAKHRFWIVLIFLLIWGLTFLAWQSARLPCTDDRPGPFPPNYLCYPSVNDAAYSIGSHYITLGEGVNNHWLTDKPLYMAFLALAQSVAGVEIDRYLSFQVAIIALLPALLFLFGRKYFGKDYGFLLAAIFAVQGYFSILLYRQVGSVNAKLENPEVLTALLLLLFGYCAAKWLRQPTHVGWAILSGGLLSLATLLRFNPVFITPVLLLVLIFAGRNPFKNLIRPILLFLLAFILVFGPWFLSARDASGQNYYVTKVEQVISSRFSHQQVQTNSPLPSEDTGEPASEEPLPGNTSGSHLLTYDLGEIGKAGAEGMVFHFFNNLYSGLAKLPTTLKLHVIDEQVKEGIWDFTKTQPIWKAKLKPENLVAIALSLALVLAGIVYAWRTYGIAGLTGLILQLGYYLGNSVSQTSGGRYLEPVHWVTLMYYSLGILLVSRFVISIFSSSSQAGTIKLTETSENSSGRAIHASQKRSPSLLLGACLLAGLILPALNLLPSKLPAETDPAIEQTAAQILTNHGLVTAAQWQQFLSDPDQVVISGAAYHPRYYRSNFYRKGNLSFEVTLLASDHVYIGYSPRIQPESPYPDGSSTILVGCRLAEDTLWSANRVITELIAVINLEKDQNLLYDAENDWSCRQ